MQANLSICLILNLWQVKIISCFSSKPRKEHRQAASAVTNDDDVGYQELYAFLVRLDGSETG